METKKKIKLAFAIQEITYLKVFMPLIKLWDQRYEIVVFIFSKKDKLTSPARSRKHLKDLGPYLKIWYKTSEEIIKKCRELKIVNLITLEGMPFAEEDYQGNNLNIIAITHMTDFYRALDWYYSKVEWILFHSKYLAKHHVSKDIDGKFMYTGSPQFLNISGFNREKILRKYNLPDKKIILVLGSQKKYYLLTKRILKFVCDYARNKDFYVIYKARKKNPIDFYLWWLLRKFSYFYDTSLFPPTSLELMFVSELVIPFDSIGIQEIIMLEKKVVNFYTKSHRKDTEIYEEKIIPDLTLGAGKDEVWKTLDRVFEADLKNGIMALKKKYFIDENEILENFLRLDKKIIVTSPAPE